MVGSSSSGGVYRGIDPEEMDRLALENLVQTYQQESLNVAARLQSEGLDGKDEALLKLLGYEKTDVTCKLYASSAKVFSRDNAGINDVFVQTDRVSHGQTFIHELSYHRVKPEHMEDMLAYVKETLVHGSDLTRTGNAVKYLRNAALAVPVGVLLGAYIDMHVALEVLDYVIYSGIPLATFGIKNLSDSGKKKALGGYFSKVRWMLALARLSEIDIEGGYRPWTDERAMEAVKNVFTKPKTRNRLEDPQSS